MVPDGRRLVFDAQGDGWTDLGVVNVDGSGERQLADGSYETGDPAKVAGGDAWSPDGRKIVYINEGGHLAVMRPNGTDRRRLAGAVFASAEPSAPLRVRGLDKVRLHADLVMLARLSQALARARAVPLAA